MEARGRLHQCYHISRHLTEQLNAVQQCQALISAQMGLVQLTLGQPSLISTAMDTLGMMAAQIESLVALTDPNTPRGTNNHSSPNKQQGRITNYHN